MLDRHVPFAFCDIQRSQEKFLSKLKEQRVQLQGLMQYYPRQLHCQLLLWDNIFSYKPYTVFHRNSEREKLNKQNEKKNSTKLPVNSSNKSGNIYIVLILYKEGILLRHTSSKKDQKIYMNNNMPNKLCMKSPENRRIEDDLHIFLCNIVRIDQTN